MPAVSEPSEASPHSTSPAPADGPLPPGWPGIAAALVGLVAVPVAVMPYLGLIAGPLLGLLALGLGVVGIVRPARRRWPAVSGLVLAALALAVSLWWWATFMGLGSSSTRVELDVQPPPTSASEPPEAARPTVAALSGDGGEALLELDGLRTSYHVAACHIDGDAQTVAVVGDDGALAASWSHAAGGVLALDVWPADTPPRRYLGAVRGGTFERGGSLPLTAGPSYHLRGSMRERDTGASVPLELHVECG